MNLEDALMLAAHVEQCCLAIDLIAVGRFLPVDQITPHSPWKISVKIPDIDRPMIITDNESLEDEVRNFHSRRACEPSAPGLLF